MYGPEWLPCISACEHVFLSHHSRQTFLSFFVGTSIPMMVPHPWQDAKKEKQTGVAGGKPSASGTLVLEFLVLTTMANSKPTKLPTLNSIFYPCIFVHTSSWARTGVVLFFFPVSSLWNLSWSSSLRNTRSFPPDLFFPLDPCNIKPFPTWSLPCLIHLNMYFILIAHCIKSFKAEIILLCLTLRRHSVNACRIEMRAITDTCPVGNVFHGDSYLSWTT